MNAMLVMSYHHNAVQLANCSILQDQGQKSFCICSMSSSVKQLVDVIGLSAYENDRPWMTSLNSTSLGRVVPDHANIWTRQLPTWTLFVVLLAASVIRAMLAICNRTFCQIICLPEGKMGLKILEKIRAKLKFWAYNFICQKFASICAPTFPPKPPLNIECEYSRPV